MTDEQAVVMESLGRGRLIFPFKTEMSDLRQRAKAGPLTESESGRLNAIEGAFEKIKIKDQWFHSAMQGGDIESAGKIAGEALSICEDLAG